MLSKTFNVNYRFETNKNIGFCALNPIRAQLKLSNFLTIESHGLEGMAFQAQISDIYMQVILH